MNEILKSLYQTNFFENIEVLFKNNNLVIKVEEFPIINQIYFDGIKSNKIKEIIMSDLKLKSRSSMNKIFLKKDQNKIIKDLKDLGYYFSKVDVLIEDLSDNKLNIRYEIELGKKANIKKINFIGDKNFKDRKLRGVIVSEEYKFWKFVSGKKYLNENLIEFDNRLLRNFYLNKGYYDVEINSSFAKLISEDEFELTFNINPNKKFF